ncbi:hypothetical protein PIB30_058600 [Stylosanthes scabra]|uniref:Uncharacterized protein n=1 Tax=Stylosanthes scabra TaxID=79078 RepID=A0ABU6VJL7_9FABA|nr:hypothetical protein [Stylosanthes scabra]
MRPIAPFSPRPAASPSSSASTGSAGSVHRDRSRSPRTPVPPMAPAPAPAPGLVYPVPRTPMCDDRRYRSLLSRHRSASYRRLWGPVKRLQSLYPDSNPRGYYAACCKTKLVSCVSPDFRIKLPEIVSKIWRSACLISLHMVRLRLQSFSGETSEEDFVLLPADRAMARFCDMPKDWMDLPRYSEEYIDGVIGFLDFAYDACASWVIFSFNSS